MIDYLDVDQINTALNDLERINETQFENIVINNFNLQILAGAAALSEPKRFLGRLTSYKCVEVRLIEIVKEEERIIVPLRDLRFKSFSWAQHYKYYNSKNQIMDSSVGYYIPIKDISSMIREIYKISKLKMFF